MAGVQDAPAGELQGRRAAGERRVGAYQDGDRARRRRAEAGADYQ